MVLGIGIDFGIQILGRYEEELGHGKSVQEAVTIALQHTGIAIITGGSTTAAAFFTLCFNDFVGLAELGLIAGFSMIFCIAANLVVLPAVFLLRDRFRTPDQLHAQSSNSAWNFIRTWDRDMVRNPWLWIVISIGISIAAAVSLPGLKFDYNLLHLDNPSAPSVQTLYKVMDASKTDAGTQIFHDLRLGRRRQYRRRAQAVREARRAADRGEGRVDPPARAGRARTKSCPIIKQIVAAAAQLNVKPRHRRDGRHSARAARHLQPAQGRAGRPEGSERRP